MQTELDAKAISLDKSRTSRGLEIASDKNSFSLYLAQTA